MSETVVLSERDARELAWRNGRGITRELAIWPPDATLERGDFDWRISAARVASSGPFSAFPGYERILVITAGDGLTLGHGDHAARSRVRRLEPYRFSGDWPTVAELAAGPVDDFNVLARADRLRAEVEVVALGRRGLREVLGGADAFVHLLAGDLVVRVTGEEREFALVRGQSLWVRRAGDGDEIDLAGRSADCAAIVVRIAKR